METTLTPAADQKLHGILQGLKEIYRSGAYTVSGIEKYTDEMDDPAIPHNLLGSGDCKVLDDVYGLLFRMLWKIGQIDDRLWPIYESLCRVKSGLLSLKHSGVYIAKDIIPFQNAMRKVDCLDSEGKIILPSERSEVRCGQALLHSLLHECHRIATNLLIKTEDIDPALQPLVESLDKLYASLERLKAKGDVCPDEVARIQGQLASIDAQRRDGKFVSPDGSISRGQAVVHTMLDQSYDLAYSLLLNAKTDEELVDPSLHTVYRELVALREGLQALADNRLHVPILEVRKLQDRVDALDATRKDGKFLTSAGSPAAPAGQAVLHYLLTSCYDLVYKLVVTSKPIELEGDFLPLYEGMLSITSRLKQLKWTPYLIEDLKAAEVELEGIVRGMRDLGILVEGTECNGEFLRVLLRQTYSLLFELFSKFDV